ncbi:unnamed protein product [Miscanthus lutarioriparius]|uniref:Uncharacterized protein n=1 Tax=Miscanthus lutarioriparius TaxID=422564 RepID=A0A811QKW0_9POAL|nr:unnamed protein product [Miscanthus lutarioriparius]
MEKFRQFVIHLLLLRKRDSSLHTCELRLQDPNNLVSHRLCDDKLGLNLWIHHIVDCEVRILRLEIHDLRFKFGMPLVSQHLTTLALVGVALTDNLCNFSNCPNLENLEFAESEFYWVQEISSKSLKHLIISRSRDFDTGSEWHTLICTPNLVSLRLDMHFSSLPVLDSMPSFKEAFLRDPMEDCMDTECYTCYDDGLAGYEYTECILLQGLSEAENLTLMSEYNGGPQRKLEMIGRYNQMKRSATISKHLKEIRVKCEVVNKKVYKVLKFLGTFGIQSYEIYREEPKLNCSA